MLDLFKAFLEEPSLKRFLELRKEIIQSESYFPYSKDFYDMGRLLKKGDCKGVVACFRASFPNLALSPGAHMMLSRAYLRDGKENLPELENHIARIIMGSILETGEGKRERPYFVLRISDEYDVLGALGKESELQSLLEYEGRFVDSHMCGDGSEVYFDITEPYLRNKYLMKQADLKMP